MAKSLKTHSHLLNGSTLAPEWLVNLVSTTLCALYKLRRNEPEGGEMDSKEKSCLGRFSQHSWSLWCSYDPHVIESGRVGPYMYYRTCTLMGCNAKQQALDLAPVGEIKETLDLAKS